MDPQKLYKGNVNLNSYEELCIMFQSHKLANRCAHSIIYNLMTSLMIIMNVVDTCHINKAVTHKKTVIVEPLSLQLISRPTF